jgi:phosphoketolase
VLYESTGGTRGTAVLAATGDMVFLPVFEARDALEAAGWKVRVVAVVNPRRLYRPGDLSWDTVSQPDGDFMSDAQFHALFDGDVLVGVSGGPSGCLEPVFLRARAPRREVVCWKRGETTATPAEIMAFNGITSGTIAAAVQG